MMRIHMLLPALLAAVFVAGCGDNDEGDGHGHDMPGMDKGMHEGMEGMSAADKAMAGLDAADQAIAKAQGTCPVSGEALGSMGTPLKMQVGDKAVFLCCKGCVKKFEADPQKYLAMTPQGKK